MKYSVNLRMSYTVFAVGAAVLCCLLGIYESQSGQQQAFDDSECQFYSHYVERQLPCNSSGYAMSYGLKYCKAFSQAYHTFNDLGKSYVNGTKQCLIRSLRPYVTQTGMTCHRLKHIAFETHADCYVDNNFCQMFPSNILSLISVYDIKNDFLFTKDFDLVTKQLLSTASKCVQRTLYSTFDSLFSGRPTPEVDQFSRRSEDELSNTVIYGPVNH